MKYVSRGIFMINPKIGASHKKLVAIFGQSRKIPLKGDYFYAKKS